MSETEVSIIINNYNYARFLRETIESALRQSYPRTEVIVVDDGSTDDSPQLIAECGARVTPVLKENGGQASALNAGFQASQGRVILYLDADDVLLPTAVEEAVARFTEPDVVKVHWPLAIIDRMGGLTGRTFPASTAGLPDGDLRQQVVRIGPATGGTSPPMSGNAWSRRFLSKVLPIPEVGHRIGADAYLYQLAPFYGPIKAVRTPQSLYRVHGKNSWWNTTFAERLASGLALYEGFIPVAISHCRTLGLDPDVSSWRANSWWHRLDLALKDICELMPPGADFIVVDDATLGVDDTVMRHPIPFLERDGQHWGPPPADAVAIRELERLRQRAGAGHIVFAWPAFWWLDYYAGFRRYLRSRFPCALENDHLIAFDLTR